PCQETGKGLRERPAPPLELAEEIAINANGDAPAHRWMTCTASFVPLSGAPSQRPLPVPKGLLMNLLLRPVRSSLGSKYVMAVTGLGLIGFVIAHMLGNLQIFLGRQALNDYAHHLEEIPTILWTLRAGLL